LHTTVIVDASRLVHVFYSRPESLFLLAADAGAWVVLTHNQTMDMDSWDNGFFCVPLPFPLGGVPPTKLS